MSRRVAIAGVALSDVGTAEQRHALRPHRPGHPAGPWLTPASTAADIDGFCSTGLGVLAPGRGRRVPRHPPPLGRLHRDGRRRMGDHGRPRR